MIVKYLSDDVWGYIDNVRQAAVKSIYPDALARCYDDRRKAWPVEVGYQDPCEYMNGQKLPDTVILSNKAFTEACDQLNDEGINRHSENLLNCDPAISGMPAVAILVYLEECKEYDAILLATNQKAFLMNDKGQTIERLN